jgi:hypothetical protein
VLPETLNAGGTSQEFPGSRATTRVEPRVRFWRTDGVWLFPILIAIAILFATSQGEGQHWFSDAPRHALNGAFLRDFLLNMPLRDPRDWAINYYLQYPALTILFYPPLFAALEAVTFLILGVSTKAALFTVALCYFALGVGAFRLMQRWMPTPLAAAAAVFFIGFPEVALWGRQVMLDVPVSAFLVWTLVWFLRFLDTNRARDLYLSAALLLAALYTKQTVVFMAPVLAAVFVAARGWQGLADRRLWRTLAAAAVGVIPLAVFTIKFGQTNMESVSGIVDSEVARMSFAGLTYYLAILPNQIGWIAVVLAVGATIALLLKPAWRPPRADLLLLALWFAVGYVFFWSIDLKSARFTLVMLLPLAAVIFIVLSRALPPIMRLPVGWALAIAGFAYTIVFAPVPVIGGYMQAAQWIRDHTPPGTVMFSGMRDGSFIFNLRTLDPERRYSVLRSDKMFLELAIRREAGVREKPIRREQIAPLLTSYGVGYVVAERDFWTDLRPMALLQEVLDSNAFEEVARIPVTGNVPHIDKELRIYRNRAPLPEKAARLRVDLPAIGQHFEGTLPAPGAAETP